ncbi:MAG: hypothetical protein KA956_05485 [Pyrinomonadaceae bacterium]|nr:hypothetical protein [Acidobacteriota bacterium]MBP7375908.1 hypothetical protein [Pyrinomonadaceae bacterium]
MSEHFISREVAEGDLLACAAFLAENIKSADGRAEAMNAVVPRYLALGNVDLAAELADTVDDPFSRDKLLVIVAEHCASIDDDDYAVQLADAIEDDGMAAQARERIALIKASNGEFEKAREVAGEIMHPDFVEAGIAVKQAADGDEAAAFATIEEIEFASARVLAYQNIASADVESENFERAIDAATRASESAKDIEHDEERIRALCDIGNLYVEAKRNDKAIEAFDAARAEAELLDNVHRDFFLANCALGFLYANSQELADRTLDLVTDKTHMASALLGMARYSWKKDAKDEAVEILEEAWAILKSQREIETRDSRARNKLMASIATQFAGFGKTERAIEIANENDNQEEQTSALSQIAQVLIVQNEDELARNTINEIPEYGDRVFALLAISDAKNNLGETEASIKLLDEAAGMTSELPQQASRSAVLNVIADRYISHGLFEKARNVGEENLTVISGIRDESTQAASLVALSEVYLRAGFELTDEERSLMKNMLRTVAW